MVCTFRALCERVRRGLDFAAVDSQPRNNMTLMAACVAAPRRSRACLLGRGRRHCQQRPDRYSRTTSGGGFASLIKAYVLQVVSATRPSIEMRPSCLGEPGSECACLNRTKHVTESKIRWWGLGIVCESRINALK